MPTEAPLPQGPSPACACGSPRTIRHGADPKTHLRLREGRAVRVPGSIPRYLCRGCGKTFTRWPAEIDAAERAVRDRAADLVFAMGKAAAARELDLDKSVVGTLLDRWHEGREVDVLDAAPDFLFLEGVSLTRKEVVLVADVDRETLVEVVGKGEELDGWLSRPDRLPALRVSVPIDPGIADAVRRHLSDAILMVAPSAVGRAISRALALGLRGIRRGAGMGGCNAFPSTARFLRAVEGHGVRDDGWPPEVMGLLGAGRLARDIAGAPDAARGRRLWREFDLAVSVPGAAPLARLMATWRDAILAGLDHRFVDRFALALEQVRRAAEMRRPSLAPREFRGLVLLRDFQRAAAQSRYGSASTAVGRPVPGLVELLRAGPPDTAVHGGR